MSENIQVKESNSNESYTGVLSSLPIDSVLSFGPVNNCGGTPTIRIYLAKYRSYPCTNYCTGSDTSALLHVTTIMNYVCNELKHDSSSDIVTQTCHRQSKKYYTYSRLCDLGNGVMFDFTDISVMTDLQNPNKYAADLSEDYFLVTSQFTIHYLPENEKFVTDLVDKFSQMTLISTKSCTLQMVCRNQNGYYLNGINIKRPLITDLALHYGKNFVPLHDRIIKNLNKKEGKGIVLLHGIPGSGKTHYIRYLIHEIEDKTLIYVPPDMAKEISSPEFLPFLMAYQDSVLIIEDAENIIKDRNETLVPSQAVANLLNLSDGLLGDAMHQQIIATFNCDLKAIDPALLRKGRLIANYEFNKLDVESSKILSGKLGFGIDGVNEPMTLAEIYNQGESTDEEKLDENLSSKTEQK